MKNYHDLYVKCDILLLVDVLKTIRNNSLKKYGLCPSHYLSVPGRSWDTMHKLTKIKLEVVPDPDNVHIIWERYKKWHVLYL